MRLPLALALGALLGSAQASHLVYRQDDGNSGSSGSASPGPEPTTQPPEQTTSAPPPNESDTTTTLTTTVTADGDVATSTVSTTVGSTIVSTVKSTTTIYTTTTVTRSDSDVETSTVYTTVTTTGSGNDKRGFDYVPAPQTEPPAPRLTAGLNNLQKRATITDYVTVTAGGGTSTETVTATISQDVVSRSLQVISITSVDTVTRQANARSTTTTTLTRTQTSVETGVETKPGETDVGNNDGGSNGGSKGGSDDGLSTGAKAGIGAGVGVGALLIIGALIFFCMRRRRSPKADPDMMAGASEVPVGGHGSRGGTGNGSVRPMSHNSSNAGAYLAAARPPVSKTSPEGYRGTAMGDGRAGYAKPNPYGSTYSRSSATTGPTPGSGPDSLPEHPHPGGENAMTAVGANTVSPVSRNSPGPGGHVAPVPTPSPQPPQHPMTAELGADNMAANKWHSDNAAEIDSQPVMSHQSGPVYEMPTEPYR